MGMRHTQGWPGVSIGPGGLVVSRGCACLGLTLAATVALVSVTTSAAAQREGDAAPTSVEAVARPPADVTESTDSGVPVAEPSTSGDASEPSISPPEGAMADAAEPAAAVVDGEAASPVEAAPSSASSAGQGQSAAKAPVGFKTGPALVVAAGTLSGVGIGYRQFYGRFGLQVAGIGVMFDDGGFGSAGLQLYYTILRNGVARFYGLIGGSIFHDYDRDVDFDITTRETTIFAGAGLGVSIEVPSGFLLALELPMHAVIRTHNSRFLVTPGVSASIGYAF